MIEFLKNLFGDPNERALKKIWPLVDEVNDYAEEYETLSDDELQAKTGEFKQEIREAVAPIEAEIDEVEAELSGVVGDPQGDGQAARELERELTPDERQDLYDEAAALEEEWLDVLEDTLDEIMPRAFAVVKETCRRHLGETWEAGGSEIEWDMVPYDVQILGAIALHQGKVAEMKTGEGKTLAAVMPLYLNALAGRGTHLITVNPYLAERDAEWMGPIYEFLGLSVDVVNRYEPHSDERHDAYRADITYGTNNEFGFDYLRDNSFVVDEDQLVQREHHYAIIDEIDSVLIDEARTPLIISGPVPEQSNDQFEALKPVVEKLVYAQKKLVGKIVSDAKDYLEERDRLQEEGKKGEARDVEHQAGLALLRASRGFPKNRTFQKLLQEPGVERLMQKTESFYLQDNAKRMPEVDEVLYFAVEEKKHAIEMTDKGHDYVGEVAQQDRDFFVLPDVGSRVAEAEEAHETKRRERKEEIESREDISEEKKKNKWMNDSRIIDNDLEERKREIYNTYSEKAERLHAVEQLLKAYTLYENEDEYIVEEGKVQIVDEHTGRVMSGRRYSEGLHQAIEAKEEVEVQQATQTYAKITLQNFFRKYHKLAGMTGTAETEAEEFDEIYDLKTLVIPTNEPVIRDDKDDLVFRTKREKYNAVIQQIEEYHDRGQPVLVGTTSVDVSEKLSRMLQRTGVHHNVLNAKKGRVQKEADIVAEAGQQGAVTIATNMAGRGTDIELGEGVVEKGGLAILGTERHESRRIDLQLRGRSGRQGDPGESQFYVSLEDDLMRLFGSDRVAKVMDSMNMEEGAVIESGLVTRSIKRAQSKVEKNHFSIRKKQLEYDDVLDKQREAIYQRRRRALKGKRLHSEILDMLHELIVDLVEHYYGQGDFEELNEEIMRRLAFEVDLDREEYVKLGEEGTVEHLYEEAADFYKRKRDGLAGPFYRSMEELTHRPDEERPERVVVDFTDGQRGLRAVAGVEDAIASKGQEINDAMERVALLSFIDEHWTDHLRELDEVREGIGLRSFGRKDPLLEYKMEAYEMFTELVKTIDREVVSFVFRAGPLVEQQEDAESFRQRSRMDRSRAQTEHEDAQQQLGAGAEDIGPGEEGAEARQRASGAQRDPSSGGGQPVVVEDEPGRNDRVTIQNTSTGETATLKYKYAQKKLKKGWSLISVEE